MPPDVGMGAGPLRERTRIHATVIAVGETECWRLGKERFREVLENEYLGYRLADGPEPGPSSLPADWSRWRWCRTPHLPRRSCR